MNNEPLTLLLENLKTDLINSLQANGSSATGQTAKQLVITNGGNSLQLALPGYMQLLETGRGPTSQGAIPGDPPMIIRIQQWCQAKGIPDKAAWAIKRAIDKKGYKGKPGIISGPLGDDNINRQLNPVVDGIAAALLEELFNSI